VTTLAVMATIGLGSYGLRAALLVLLPGRRLPAGVDRGLLFIGPAAAAAMLSATVATRAGHLALRPVPELVAVAAGFVAARRTGNAAYAFAFGLPVLWLVSALPL